MALAVQAPSKAVYDELEHALTYNKVETLRGKAAKEYGSPFKVTPVECYYYTQDEDGIIPSQLVTAAGYRDLITQRIAKLGYEVDYVDVTKRVRESVFVPHWDRLKGVEFRYMQRETLQAMLDNPFGQILCPPSFGKSFLMACYATLLPKARIDITTYSVDVIRQLHNDLCGRLGSVGLVGGGKKEYGQRVTCYSLKSLHHSDGNADALLVDELHEAGTDDNMQRIARYRRARRYGLSGSIGDRTDGADFELLGAFGPVIINVTQEEAEKHGNVVPIEVHWRDVIMNYNPCGMCDDPTIRLKLGIWQNDYRNRRIAEAAREFDDDDQVLIFVTTVEHAIRLKALLPEFVLCYSEAGLPPSKRNKYIRDGLLSEDEPDMTTARRMQLKDAFSDGTLKKVIATTVWNRGVDFQKLSVLIRADGQNSPIADTQVPGRVTRICKETGKRYGIVIDFLDHSTAGFKPC
jgi:superfamily II DNA or RNA helicase